MKKDFFVKQTKEKDNSLDNIVAVNRPDLSGKKKTEFIARAEMLRFNLQLRKKQKGKTDG